MRLLKYIYLSYSIGKKIIYLSIILVGLNVNAQMLSLKGQRPQVQIIWDNESIYYIERFGTKIKIGNLKDKTVKEIPLRTGTLGVGASNNLICFVMLNENTFRVKEQLPTGEITDYILDVDINPDQFGFPIFLYATDKPNLYFGMNVDVGFTKNKEASCCAWWRKLDNGHFVLDQIIPIDRDGPIFLPSSKDGKPFLAQADVFRPGLFPILDYPIRISGAFILVSWKSGLLWVIKDGASSPSHVIDLVGIEKDFLKGKHPFPSAILGIQPLKNNHLLIARRTKKAITETYKNFEISLKSEPRRELDYKQAQTERDAATISHADIEWVDLDPMTGVQEPADSFIIVKAPALLNSEQDIMKFGFGFDLNEKLIIPWKPIEIRIDEPVLNRNKTKGNIKGAAGPPKL